MLLGLICASGLWISWQMLFIVTDTLDARWAFLWTFDAGWHVLYFGMLATICMLWSPSKNNLQYAYMDELAHEDPGEEVGDHEEDADGFGMGCSHVVLAMRSTSRFRFLASR